MMGTDMSDQQQPADSNSPLGQTGSPNRRHWSEWIHWRIGRDVALLTLMGFAAVGAVIGASTGIASLRQVEKVRVSHEQLLDGTPEQSARFAANNPSNPHLTLVSSNRERYVDVVIGENRTEGWTLESNLGPAASNKRYQIWVEAGGNTYPVAFAGRKLTNVYFSFPPQASAVFVTEEPESGTMAPTGDRLAGGNIPLKEL